jgi:16S rRNA (cytosine967-C5)-methyltransferase
LLKLNTARPKTVFRNTPGRGAATSPAPRFDLGVACDVIRKSDQQHPADTVLRQELKAQRVHFTEDKRAITQAVFAYYRWLGWLTDEKVLEAKLRRALELDGQFRKNPLSFATDVLRANAVPAWVAGEMEIQDDWLRALQREPKLWLRARAGQGRALAKKLGLSRTLAPPEAPDALLYDGSEDLFRTPEFHAGEFEIQDASSQLVGQLCGPKPGETWWDACAGEGGKMLHLSDLMQNKGLIWASDRAEWRLKNLKRRAARAKVFNFRSVLWDGGPKPPTKTKFDGALVDAPCSGLGTWQRNPHARWTTTPQDVRELSELQRKLLAHVAPSVKPGGKLIYSVCTLTRAETSKVAEEFSRAHAEFELLLLNWPPAKENQSLQTSSPTITVWPQDFGGNGMYIAAWRRKV